jgi:hypothetical protein
MFGYDLKPYEMFGYPFFFGVLAVVLARAFPSPEMTVFLYAFEFNVAFVGVFYLWHESCKYVDGQMASKPTTPHIDLQPTRAADTMPQIKAGGMVYSQQAQRLKIDCVAKFNQIILTQLDGGLPVEMTENYWVKLNGDTQSQWQRIGGVGPTDWRNMIERGIKCHAYKRVGGQNKCVPDNRAIIRSLARGYPLPQ